MYQTKLYCLQQFVMVKLFNDFLFKLTKLYLFLFYVGIDNQQLLRN